MGDLTDAFNRTVEAAELADIDTACAAAGRVIANQIDEARETMTGQDLTKALYLTPHLMNVLREMQATPASRADLKTKAKSSATVATSGKDEVGEKRATRGWRTA